MTPEQLRAATGCTVYSAQTFAPFLTEACVSWGIDTPVRIAAFVAQAAYESHWFTRMEEDLNYTTAIRLCQVWPKRFRLPYKFEGDADVLSDGRRNAFKYVRQPEKLADFVYGGRMGNGPEGLGERGDGWNYRGRGVAMLTGRRNYEAFAKASAVPADNSPGVVAMPNIGCDAFGWFWRENGLNELADLHDDAGLTRAINGGLTGFELEDDKPLSDRQELLAQARLVFC